MRGESLGPCAMGKNVTRKERRLLGRGHHDEHALHVQVDHDIDDHDDVPWILRNMLFF